MTVAVRDLIRAARQAGWHVTCTGSGHIRLVSPISGRAAVVISSTPSDHRSWLNALADLRRAGLPITRRTRPVKRARNT